MKKGWEKRFDKMWFAPKGETTIMDWTGLFKDTRSWLFPIGHSPEYTEQALKESLAQLVKSFIKSETLGVSKIAYKGKSTLHNEK